jgi:antitoxin ParD1/3/4
MNVSITPELEQFVAARVASGQYQSASEVVRAALRLLVREEEVQNNSRRAPKHEPRKL